MDNRVTDGQRNVTIMTTDASGAESAPITAYITVVDRNDGPVVNVGGGDSMDFMVTFVENGSAIPIGTYEFIACSMAFIFLCTLKHGSKTSTSMAAAFLLSFVLYTILFPVQVGAIT